MKFVILLLIIGINDPNNIALINAYKADAEQSFLAKDFSQAISQYKFLMDSLNVNEDAIHLNLGHAYHQMGDTAQARTAYNQATLSSNADLKSIAYQQLGVISKSNKNLKESLAYLKASIKANPANSDSKYDFELVKKLMQENQDQEDKEDKEDQQDKENQEDKEDKEDQQDKENQEDKEDQENKDQNQESDSENEEEKEQEGDEQEGDEQEQDQKNDSSEEENQDESLSEDIADEKAEGDKSTQEKLAEMNISPEKAEMILEAMQNGEIQYIQQQKRKSTEKQDKGKPDW